MTLKPVHDRWGPPVGDKDFQSPPGSETETEGCCGKGSWAGWGFGPEREIGFYFFYQFILKLKFKSFLNQINL